MAQRLWVMGYVPMDYFLCSQIFLWEVNLLLSYLDSTEQSYERLLV